MIKYFCLMVLVMTFSVVCPNLGNAQNNPNAQITRISFEINPNGFLNLTLKQMKSDSFGIPNDFVEIKKPNTNSIYKINKSSGLAITEYDFSKKASIADFSNQEALEIKNNLLYLDPKKTKENKIIFELDSTKIKGPPLKYPIYFDLDIVSQGQLNLKAPDQNKRTIAFNFSVNGSEGASHISVAIQAIDTKVTSGNLVIRYKDVIKNPNGPLQDLTNSKFERGQLNINQKLPNFPKNPHLKWWTVNVINDGAYFQKFRFGGIATPDLGCEFKSELGIVKISEIKPGGPAFAAGIKLDDVVSKIGNKPIRNLGDALEIINEINSFNPIELDISRNDKIMKIIVKPE